LTEAELHGKGCAKPKHLKFFGKEQLVVKEKWGTKRTCPKCGTRFYDLGKDNPVVCLDCANEWVPEPILKSRQPQLEEVKKPEAVSKAKEGAEAEAEAEDEDDTDEVDDILVDADIDIDEDDDDINPDDDLDLDDGSDVPVVIVKPKSPDGD